MNLVARLPSFVSFSTSVSPGKRYYGKQEILLLQKIDQGNLKASLQQIIQNWIVTVFALLKSGELRVRRTIDQGNLIKLLG